ncbi:VOC family protein [Nocardia sp. NPDC048505]|uniref:VOC family protein n=1 Tax=unclassified Nocardia TaxID=2637762 RepID=UPI0033C141C5
MSGIAEFGAIALDSRDPRRLAQFYSALLGFKIRHETEEVIVLGGKGTLLTIERVADHVPPIWPGNQVPKQMHLDLFVQDLELGERAAIELGAVKAEFQPAPGKWRVLLDPAGHPFCLTTRPGA